MTAGALLRSVVAALDQAGIPFMLTGSLAAAFHGAGRATMDIDMVIDPTMPQLRALVRAMAEAGKYVSAEAAEEAMALRSSFNVIDSVTGWKADLIVRKQRVFSNTEFARRQPAIFEGCRLWVAAVEDVILAKLEWARLGPGSILSGHSTPIEGGALPTHQSVLLFLLWRPRTSPFDRAGGNVQRARHVPPPGHLGPRESFCKPIRTTGCREPSPTATASNGSSARAGWPRSISRSI